PIRPELLKGNKDFGLSICKFNTKKPIVLIIGGSLGAVAINQGIRNILKKLLTKFQVIHICGKGNIDNSLLEVKGYRQFEYVGDELPHLMAAADIVVSRAGANAIHELLALRKPALLIPLPLSASRGDQIYNAKSFERQGFSKVLFQEDMTEDLLYSAILDLYRNKSMYVHNMESHDIKNSTEIIIDIIDECTK